MIYSKIKSRLRRSYLKIKYMVGIKNTILRLSNGSRFLLKNNDDICMEIYDEEQFEKRFVNLFSDSVKEGAVIIDIGSNLGYFTVLAASRTKNSGKVYSVEINTELIKHQQKQLALNGFKNVELINTAVSDAECVLPFYLAPEQFYGHSSLKQNSTFVPEKVIEVQCTTLDQLVSRNNIKRIDIIKIDVEGAEFNVLKGAESTLRTFRPTIFFESADELTEGFNYTTSDLICYLKGFDYTIRQVEYGMWFAQSPSKV